jgi:hypothetical protein
MSVRGARAVAWTLAAVAIALQLVGVVLFATVGRVEAVDAFTSGIALAFSAVGVLIATRHPGNTIGWIFLGVAAATGFGGLAHGYAEYWVTGHGGAAGLAKAAAAYGELSWMPFVLVPATFLLLLFPDGRLPSTRWRVVAWCAAAGIAGTFVAGGLRPGRIPDYPSVVNPYGVDSPLVDGLEAVGILLLFVGIVGSASSLIVRFRRARREQRQQIKWLALAGAAVAATLVIAVASYDLLGETVANAAIMASVLCLPAAAGVAILRHRLYDIDVVINRALVYAALTATLAASYVGSVLLLQLALSPGSDLAVAGSTLAVAALFQPARGRIQELVDRRFYRRKYDAQRTLEAFSARLRDQVELQALNAELDAVVRETLQPAHVSLWLRETAR